MRASLVLGLLLPCFLGANAQSTTTAGPAAPDGKIHTEIEGITVPAIPGAPFTAKEVVTWDQPLVGGGTISRKYYTVVARDSQGRVRRENREFVSASSTADPPLRSFSIIDPTTGTRTRCTQAATSCATAAYTARLGLADEAASAGSTANVSRISLGNQSMESLPVVGTREIRSSSTRDRLLVSQTDLWYSPDLQMYLYVVRNNPQMGQVTLTMTDVVRGEPDPSLLSVPPNFSAQRGRP